MKHFVFFFHIISFLAGFLSIALGLLTYDRFRDSRLKYYILFLVSLTMILFEQIVTAYEIINFIDKATLNLMLQTVSALGCILMVYALPLLVFSLHEVTITRPKRVLIYVLTSIPVLALLFYYFTPYKFLSMVTANTLLFLTVLVSLVYSTVRFKSIRNVEIRHLYGSLIAITFIAFPFMYIDSRFRSLAFMQKYFPYGMLSVSIYYFVWNVVFLMFAYRYYKRFISRGAENEGPDFAEKYRITKREKEVMMLLIDGKSYSEISETLSISLSTVKTHVYNIYQKTGVNNKVELINLIK